MGSVFSRGDSWVIEYRKPDGKLKRESVGKRSLITKTMAREILRKKESQIKLGLYDMLEAVIPALADFSKEYLEYQKEVKQKRSWRKDEAHLKSFNKVFGKMKLSDITAKHIDDYKSMRLQTVKPSSVDKELEVLRHLFYLAKKWKRFFGENPVSESGLLKVNNQQERILSFDEEERLINSSPPHIVPIIVTALSTGMRKMEMLTLTWNDVDLENNAITVRKETTKSKKPRKVPINSILKKLLFEQKLRTRHSGYVFPTPVGYPYSPTNTNALHRIFSLACKKAGIDGLRFHDLRHTAATRMVENTGNIVAVSKILGHADLKTTMRYTHPEDSLVNAVESLCKHFSDSVTDKSTDTGNKQ